MLIILFQYNSLDFHFHNAQKLLRINLINVYNDSGFWIPSTLAISNSMDYSGVNSEEEGESVLDSIVETVPVHTNLEDGLAEFVNQSG